MDLISREQLRNIMGIKEECNSCEHYKGLGCEYGSAFANFCEAVDATPTVDAVEVVRCKDCIHRYSSCPMITMMPNWNVQYRAKDDWFCFMGERAK